MLVIRLLNLSSKFLFLLIFFIFFHFQAIGDDSADIWKKDKNKEKENIEKKKYRNKAKN